MAPPALSARNKARAELEVRLFVSALGQTSAFAAGAVALRAIDVKPT